VEELLSECGAALVLARAAVARRDAAAATPISDDRTMPLPPLSGNAISLDNRRAPADRDAAFMRQARTALEGSGERLHAIRTELQDLEDRYGAKQGGCPTPIDDRRDAIERAQVGLRALAQRSKERLARLRAAEDRYNAPGGDS
jgi:hypothetical protein